MPIRIAITDDHPLVIIGLTQVLSQHAHIAVEGKYHSGAALLAGLEQTLPDVLLLDIQLPDMQGNELARIISRKYPSVRILALTSLDNTFHAKDMLQQGCLGYLLKNTDPQILVQAI